MARAVSEDSGLQEASGPFSNIIKKFTLRCIAFGGAGGARPVIRSPPPGSAAIEI